MLKCFQVFILIMSRNGGTGTCKHSWKVGMHDKEGRATTDMVSKNLLLVMFLHGFSGLGVACWPLVPKFVGSNPAEAIRVLG